MESKSLTGKWKGFFSLDESYGPILKGKKGYFEIDLEDHEGKLNGNCVDTHGFGVKEKRSSIISGTFENGWITIVKKYEKAIPIDAFGDNIEGAAFNSVVHYDGTVDHLGKKMSGNWKISIRENPKNEEDFTTGNWEMTKE
jgi:hypothetical protein